MLAVLTVFSAHSTEKCAKLILNGNSKWVIFLGFSCLWPVLTQKASTPRRGLPSSRPRVTDPPSQCGSLSHKRGTWKRSRLHESLMGFARLRLVNERGRAVAPLGGYRQPFAAESCHSLFHGWGDRGRQLPYVLDYKSLGLDHESEFQGASKA